MAFNEPSELWSEIEDFPNYLVSSDGRIINRMTRRELVQSINSNGYLWVTLYNDGVKYTTAVHRLVSVAFNGETPDGLETNHIDGVKTNNNLENFEFVTRSENIKHAYKMGLAKRSDNAGSKKHLVRNVCSGEVFKSISHAARSINANPKHLSAVINGRGKTVKGHKFELVD